MTSIFKGSQCKPDSICHPTVFAIICQILLLCMSVKHPVESSQAKEVNKTYNVENCQHFYSGEFCQVCSSCAYKCRRFGTTSISPNISCSVHSIWKNNSEIRIRIIPLLDRSKSKKTIKVPQDPEPYKSITRTQHFKCLFLYERCL